jgi:hypothetical protein
VIEPTEVDPRLLDALDVDVREDGGGEGEREKLQVGLR